MGASGAIIPGAGGMLLAHHAKRATDNDVEAAGLDRAERQAKAARVLDGCRFDVNAPIAKGGYNIDAGVRLRVEELAAT